MKEKNKIHNTILSLLDVRRYDGEIQAFQKEDSTYFDLLQISGRDLNALKDEDVWYDIRVYTMLYRTYPDDLKWICTTYPTDVSEQQRYWLHKLKTTHSPVFRQWIETEIAKLEWLTGNRADKEYYVMIFAKDREDLRERRNTVQRCLKQYVQEIPAVKKARILEKFYNQTEQLFPMQRKEEPV